MYVMYACMSLTGFKRYHNIFTHQHRLCQSWMFDYKANGYLEYQGNGYLEIQNRLRALFNISKINCMSP